MNALTAREEPALPAELNATLEPWADFAKGVGGTRDAGRLREVEIGCPDSAVDIHGDD
jgi:hypothetical protein